MKTLIVALLTAALLIFALRSGVTPWTIVRTSALSPTSPAILSGPREAVRLPAATPHSADWMHDPKYRTSLEKTTLVGRPEPATSRDTHPR